MSAEFTVKLQANLPAIAYHLKDNLLIDISHTKTKFSELLMKKFISSS